MTEAVWLDMCAITEFPQVLDRRHVQRRQRGADRAARGGAAERRRLVAAGGVSSAESFRHATEQSLSRLQGDVMLWLAADTDGLRSLVRTPSRPGGSRAVEPVTSS
jgi:hypothetical protein